MALLAFVLEVDDRSVSFRYFSKGSKKISALIEDVPRMYVTFETAPCTPLCW